METVQQKLEAILGEKGMSEKQAKDVIELAKPEMDNLVEDYSMTWNQPSDEYPDVIYNVLMIGIKKIALKYIDDNCPQAWVKPMFVI